MLHTLRFFFSSKCRLFYNANLFGSCIIGILHTECAKIKCKMVIVITRSRIQKTQLRH